MDYKCVGCCAMVGDKDIVCPACGIKYSIAINVPRLTLASNMVCRPILRRIMLHWLCSVSGQEACV